MVLSDMETIRKPTSSAHYEVGISRTERDLSPAHYLFKIQSYSLLKEAGVEKYETNVFEACGYKWRLILYPSGNPKSNGSGHVSLHLAIADTKKLSHGWEVNVNFKLFVFNQKKNKYLTIQDADGAVRKFHEMKTEWGFEQLISLETLSDSSNGYLVEDSCVFGAEVFVISNSGICETLSIVKDPPQGSFTWKLENFSTLDKIHYLSKSFTVGERNWKLRVYPKGNVDERGKGLSVFLELTDCEKFPQNRKVYAKFKLRILDQLHSKYYEKSASHWFCASSNEWGHQKLVSLSELHEAAKGYIKDDSIIVAVQILAISTTHSSCSPLTHQSEKMVLSDSETISKPTSSAHSDVGIISRSERDLPPAHYLFKIQSYSLLVDTGVEKYETNVFQAGGHKWRLILYPSGNLKSNGSGHVSLYLAIADTEKLSHGWEVNVNFKLFVFNQKSNKYLTIQDADGAVRKFHEMKTEWGFEQLISLETLFDSSNGYLVEDSCVFGAEVFVISQSDICETLSMVKDPPQGSFTWKLENFSTLDKIHYLSKSFTVGERDWKLRVYPKGNVDERGKGLSVFLELTDCEKFSQNRTVYAKFKLRILDQLHNKYYEKTAKHWFSASSNEWGYQKFVSLGDLHDAAKGYMKDDAIIVAVEILVISTTKISS